MRTEPAYHKSPITAALRDNEEQSGRFIGTIAGIVPIPEFFSPENMRRLTGAGGH